MNKLKSIIIGLVITIIPSIAFAFSVPWNATSTTQGWIFPTKVNGVEQSIVGTNFISTSTTASSTFAGPILKNNIPIESFGAFRPYSGNPVITSDSAGKLSTWVSVWKEGATWHMYYTHDETTVHEIYHATSVDGKTWTKDTANNPVLTVSAGKFDATGVWLPTVWKEGSTWYMIYNGRNGTPSGIGLATSTDGVSWTKTNSGNAVMTGNAGTWDENDVEAGAIIKVGSVYYMWYGNVNNGGSSRATGFATSTDLMTWNKNTTNPLFLGGRFCNSIFWYNNKYYLTIPHYTYNSDYVEFEMYSSDSPEMTNRQYLGVIKRTSISGWDRGDMDVPFVFTDTIQRNSFNATNGDIWIYYSGTDNYAVDGWQTGLLISQHTNSAWATDYGALESPGFMNFGFFSASSTYATSSIMAGLNIGTSSVTQSNPSKLVLDIDRNVRGIYIQQQVNGANSAIRVAASSSVSSGIHLTQAGSGYGFYTEATNANAVPLHVEGVTSQVNNLMEIETGAIRQLTMLGSGLFGLGTTSPFARLSVAGDSYIGGNLTATGTLAVTGAGTSTFVNGIDIDSGCFAINGVCVSGGGGGGITSLLGNSLTKGNFLVGNDSNLSQATSSIFVSSIGNIGIGTTSPFARLSVSTTSTENALAIGNDTRTALIVKNNGYVGIGLANPQVPFSVNTDTNAKIGFEYSASSTGIIGLTSRGAGIQFSRPSDGAERLAGIFNFNLYGLALGSRGDMAFLAGGANNYLTAPEVMRISTTGNIGIGTSSPSAKLSIDQTLGGSSPLFSVASSTSGAGTSTALYVASNGNVGIGTANPTGDLSIVSKSGGNAYTFTNSSLNGNGWAVFPIFADSANSSYRLDPANTGNSLLVAGSVGIGTTTPNTTLQVAGFGASTGPTFSLNNTNGFTANRIFTLINNYDGVSNFMNIISENSLRSATTTIMTFRPTGNVGIGTTSPYARLSVAGDIVSSSLIATSTTATSSIAGHLSIQGKVVSPNLYPAFTYATSTAWTGTTTIPLGVSFNGETWAGIKCFTDVGTVNVSIYDGTNRMNMFNASTTVGKVILSTNNVFNASEKRYVDIGTPASAPTSISCTVSRNLTTE